MAIYKIFPEKDATLYSAFPDQNTGLDSILESSTTFLPDSPEASRFVIKFSSTEIDDIITNKISGSVTDITGTLDPASGEFSSSLRCFIADISGLSTDTTLEIFPLAEPWNMGRGKYLDDPKTEDGCSWKWRLSSGSGQWSTSAFGVYITSSYPTANPGGGVWYTGSATLDPTQTQTFNYSSDKDINSDVSNAIRLINSGTINNEGFIIKQSSSTEFQSVKSDVANIKFFSIDTNTIYPPQLEFKWRDFIIDFDNNYTQISADSNGSYFKLYMNGLEPERYYKIIIKTTIDDQVLVLDDDYYFKIING